MKKASPGKVEIRIGQKKQVYTQGGRRVERIETLRN